MEGIGLGELTFQEISEMSLYSIKKLVKEKTRDAALQELNMRKSVLTKIAPLQYNTLTIQRYLLKPTSNRHKRVEFRWRTRMTKVGWNYGLKSKCPLCNEEDDTQEHLLICNQLNNHIDSHNASRNIIKQIEAALRKRERLVAAKDVSMRKTHITAGSQDAT